MVVFFCVPLIYVSVLMSARLCRTVLITVSLEYILKLAQMAPSISPSPFQDSFGNSRFFVAP